MEPYRLEPGPFYRVLVDHLEEFLPIGQLRRVTAHVAEAVVREARDRGLGRPFKDAEIPPAVAAAGS